MNIGADNNYLHLSVPTDQKSASYFEMGRADFAGFLTRIGGIQCSISGRSLCIFIYFLLFVPAHLYQAGLMVYLCDGELMEFLLWSNLCRLIGWFISSSSFGALLYHHKKRIGATSYACMGKPNISFNRVALWYRVFIKHWTSN
jgi:hypothetical protein